jgi:hypothetical protein
LGGPFEAIAGRDDGKPAPPSGDGGPALDAKLGQITAVAVEADGGVLLVDRSANRIRRIRSDGVIESAAGTGAVGYSGDGGPATSAELDLRLNGEGDVAALPDGGFLIADEGNDRVRSVDADGRITTVAGTGKRESRGDGGPARAASLRAPNAVAFASDGSILVAEFGRIRRISQQGIIMTVAGTGVTASEGYGAPVGDGRTATAAVIDPIGPGLAATPNGFVWSEFSRLRMVTYGPASHPAVAVTGTRRASRGRLSVAIRSTLAGRVRLDVRTEAGRLVASGATQIDAEHAAAIITGRSVPAGRYWLTATVGSGDRSARTNIGVFAGTRLPWAAARLAAAYETAEGIGVFLPTDVRRCKRMSSRRIDCLGVTTAFGEVDCLKLVAVRLRHGFVSTRPYPCGRGHQAKFERHPRWRAPSTPRPVLTKPPPG